jgi:hypothetical protein
MGCIKHMEIFHRPLSPHQEGIIEGAKAQQYYLHFDGVDHPAWDISEEIHPDLAENPDFLRGMNEGILLGRMLEGAGYAITELQEEAKV